MSFIDFSLENEMRGQGFVVLSSVALAAQGCVMVDDEGEETDEPWPPGFYVWALDTPEGPFDTYYEALRWGKGDDEEVAEGADFRIYSTNPNTGEPTTLASVAVAMSIKGYQYLNEVFGQEQYYAILDDDENGEDFRAAARAKGLSVETGLWTTDKQMQENTAAALTP